MRITALANAEAPRDVALRLARSPGLAWLDGGLEHGREGRFSFVAASPCEVVERQVGAAQPLAALATLQTGSELQADSSLAPFTLEELPRWVGHVSYDAGRRPAPQHAQSATVPVLRFARYDAWYAFDHEHDRAYLVGDSPSACERLRARLSAPSLSEAELHFAAGPISATSPERHEAAIRAALDLIREGELYEINLARRFAAPFSGSALGLFLRMRDASPVPLGYFVDGASHAVLGRSMERFLRYRASDRAIWTSPIKGTLIRAGDDIGEAARLQSDPKEHAEHAMVVDLMRNDLSRVCEVGSVEVRELMAALPFAGLSHLVSTVVGRARSELDLGELLELTFPPGSVTGAPKERVLRAIEELEGRARGVYTGCMGFIDCAGGCSFAVAIRTAVVADGMVEYFAGGGIVADSVPERETAETELKASLFLRALGVRG